MKSRISTVAKLSCAVCLGICIALGQSETVTSSVSQSISSTSIPTTATLPNRWVNQHECDGGTSVIKRVCTQGDSLCPTTPGDYQLTPAGLNQAIVDAENLRVK